MNDQLDLWLTHCPDPATDPLPGMREAGLLEPVPDYATIARTKAAIVERTGLLGVASVWGGRHLVGRHFLSFGTNAQRAQWQGRALAVGISEPKVGAHPKLLTTRADRTETGYRITGQKAWVTNGPSAAAIIVFAITSEDAGRKRYSAFIVPRDTRGLTTADMPGFHALRPSRHCLLTLDGCTVPADAMLGAPGSAYDRMALPFRDIEDAVGTFGTLGALRHAIAQFAGAEIRQAEDLGAIVALTSVFAAGAEAVVAALDAGHFRTGDPTLVGLRVLAIDIVARLRALASTATPAPTCANAPSSSETAPAAGETTATPAPSATTAAAAAPSATIPAAAAPSATTAAAAAPSATTAAAAAPSATTAAAAAPSATTAAAATPSATTPAAGETTPAAGANTRSVMVGEGPPSTSSSDPEPAGKPSGAIIPERLHEILSDLDATLNVARGPRLARQANLGTAALRRS